MHELIGQEMFDIDKGVSVLVLDVDQNIYAKVQEIESGKIRQVQVCRLK